MKQKFKVAILGDGRIGRAVKHYLYGSSLVSRVDFLKEERMLDGYDLLVGALAGEIGERCIDLAIKYKKNLVDISDVDPPAYLKRRSQIAKSNITVIPGCGISPGLVNFILGRELQHAKDISNIEVKAGSLSKKRFFYPFLWCFEDIVFCHKLNSQQKINGRMNSHESFSGYRKENCFGIEAESYYCASGFENVMHDSAVKNFTYRVVRPYGFMHFFQFMDNCGAFNKKNIPAVKAILEARKEDNITFAQIDIGSNNKKTNWVIKATSHKGEALNSMQKITASVPAVIIEMFLSGRISGKGILFMESLPKDNSMYNLLISGVKKKGIIIKRND